MRVKWIDAAKGIAILMVIVIHVAEVMPLPGAVRMMATFGGMGVQLFFLMSAYCLCMTWRPERFDGWYWWRKYKRLIGWYAIGMVLYYLYWLWRGNVKMLSAYYDVLNIVANMTFVNGFVPSAQNALVPGGWSISCIALFVFVYPFLAWLSVRREVLLLVSASVIGMAVSLLGHYCFGWSRFFTYCMPLSQIMPFAVGVILWNRRESLRKGLRVSMSAALSVVFFLLAGASVLLSRDGSIFYRQILVSFAFAFGLLVLENCERLVPGWLVWMGKHSYEIFILHFLLIWLIF